MRLIIHLAILSHLIAGLWVATLPATASVPRCVGQGHGQICHHIFAGQVAPAPIDIVAPIPCTGLKIRMVQMSTRLTMPLGADKIVNDQSCDGYHTAPVMPNVARETVVRWHLLYRDGQGAWHELWQSPRIKIYPTTLLDALRAWAQQQPLIVDDPTGKLTAFLKQHHIAYHTRMPGITHQPQIYPVYWITDIESFEQSGWNSDHTRLVLFHERVYNFPKIKSAITAQGIRIDVEMELFDHILNDPLAQKVLIELFNMSQAYMPHKRK